MKIAIGIPCGELARYSVFYDSLIHLKLPPDNSFHQCAIQGRSANIAENRNGIAALAVEKGFDRILYVDDDQILPPDTLLRLMQHDVDIVSALYVAREPPFIPHMYDKEDARGWCAPRLLNAGDKGLVECKATGAGCMLVKTEVFKAMEKPWWRLGQITSDGWGDDMNFCHRARKAGFKVWCDLDTKIGHQMLVSVWPTVHDGQWVTAMLQGTKFKEPLAVFPAAQASPFIGVAPKK